MFYVAADYFATGEGRTIFLLITQASPRMDDYEVQPKIDISTCVYHEGKLKYSREQIAALHMKEKIDEYYWPCVNVLAQTEFFKIYGAFIPEVVTNMALGKDPRGTSNMIWFNTFHFNFS